MKKPSSYTSRTSEVSSIGDAINQMMDAYKLKKKFSETYLIACWEKIMGTAIAKRTSEIKIRDSKMYITLTSAPLKQELSMSKSKIIELMNNEAGSKIIEEVILL